MTCVFLLAEHTHPEWEDFGALEWVLVALASVAVIWTIWKAVKYTMKPDEGGDDHVKRLIFEPDDPVSSSGPEGDGPDPMERS